VLGAYAACAIYGFWGAWSQGPGLYATSGGGDQAASMWFLTWAPYSLLHLHNPLFSAAGNTPYGVNMMVNTSTLPLGWLASPITLAAGPVVSFNLLQTLAPFLSACAAYALVRRFTVWRPAAFTAGLVYGFSPYVVAAGLGHLMTAFVPLPPLIFLLLHDVLVRQSVKPVVLGGGVGLVLVVQFFISSEVLASTVMIGVVVVAVATWSGRRVLRARLGYAVRSLSIAAGVVVVLLAYPVWFMLRGPAHVAGPIQQAPQLYRADLLGPVVPDHLQRLAPGSLAGTASHFAGNASENGSYLGVTLLVLVVVASVVLWRVAVVRVAAVAGSVAFVLSLGSRLVIDNHRMPIRLPEVVFDAVPVLKNTVPVRFALYVVLAAALITGIALDRLYLRFEQRKGTGRLVTAAVAVAVLVPLVPAWPYAMQAVAVPAYFTSGAVDAVPARSVVLVFPFPDAGFANPQAWQAVTFLHFDMAGGRFNVPQPLTGEAGPSRASLSDAALSAVAAGQPPAETPELQAALRRQWRSWGIRDVIAVPTGPGFGGEVAFLTWALGRPPTTSNGVAAWYHWR
jgi:hypothetical protein